MVCLKEPHHERPGYCHIGALMDQHHDHVYEMMSWLCYGYVLVMLWLLLWLPCQPGESLYYDYSARGENKCVCNS